MDLVAAVVADEQSLELVQPGEGTLDDPAGAAEAGAVLGLRRAISGVMPRSAEVAAMGVVVIAAVGGKAFGPSARPADLAAHGRHTVDAAGSAG